MVVSETGAQASWVKKPAQGARRGSATVRDCAVLATAGWLLAGCSTMSAMNPINWWHREEGGKIAQDRPPPPGAEQPYPNMSTVPAKPDPPDQEALKKLTDSLVADRTNAQHAAQSAPLADPSSPAASPGLFGVGTAPPPPPAGNPSKTPAVAGAAPAATGSPVAGASLPAVSAPPARPTPAAPSPAPRKAVESAPLDAPNPSTGTQQPATAQALPPAPPNPGPSTVGPQPDLPTGPPPRPFAAASPPALPVVPAPAPLPSAAPAATIVFPERTSNLSAPANDEVKAFAAKRGSGTISIVGYGDSTSSDPEAQSTALNLGLSRAQSILEALKSAGVPGNAIRVSAEASGRGASLQLLQ